MADGDDRQATFGSDGSLETDTTPDATGDNDFGEAKEPNETDGGYSRYVVSSLLQKAVRRSDEEIAAWAAWELARSGYAWNLWDRLNLYVVEDLRAGSDVALTIERYEELATERWEPAEWKGRLCAIHAALAAARARSTREASNADAYFSAVAEVRAEAHERATSLLTTSPSATSNRKDSSTPSSTATPVRARGATAERTSSRPTAPESGRRVKTTRAPAGSASHCC